MTQEEQKIQELLKPRYKIIADYPHSPFPVGRLLDGNDESFLVTRTQYQDFGELHFQNNWMPIDYLEKYPHLFRKLEWWEERKPEEMPEYVKPKNPEEYRRQFGEVVLQVDKRTSGLDQFHATNLFQLASMRWSEWLPATESEYTAYIEKQPTTLNQGV